MFIIYFLQARENIRGVELGVHFEALASESHSYLSSQQYLLTPNSNVTIGVTLNAAICYVDVGDLPAARKVWW